VLAPASPAPTRKPRLPVFTACASVLPWDSGVDPVSWCALCLRCDHWISNRS
jgi:hypothetical protein